MFRNYLKTGIRNIRKYSAFSLINLTGIAIGMACCILILLWVQDELSYDRFHKNAARIYRVITHIPMSGEIRTFAISPPTLAPFLNEEYPEVEHAVRFQEGNGRLIQAGEKKFTDDRLSFADPEFFKVFTFPFVSGDPETAMADPYSVMMTETAAEKYFGNKNPVGRTLTVDNHVELSVTGIVKDVPHNSFIQFELMSPVLLAENFGIRLDRLSSFNFQTFVMLGEQADAGTFREKIVDCWRIQDEESQLNSYIQPMTDIYLRSDFNYDRGRHGSMKYVYIFSATAIFILIIACINFMNLSTARAGHRAHEVGLRKVVGAHRTDLIRQFFGESLMMAGIGLILAVGVVELVLPLFNTLSGKPLTINYVGNWPVLIGLVVIALVTGVLSGSYPALVLSSFHPVKVLKGSFSGGVRSSVFRNVFVVIQFALSIVFIIGTIVINNQLAFIMQKDLGYDAERLVSITMNGAIPEHYDAIKSELLQNPEVAGVSASDQRPSRIGSATSGAFWEGRNPEEDTFMVSYAAVDYDYAETLDMQMKEGRFFSREYVSDTLNFVLNETAVRRMGLESPVGSAFTARGKTGVVIGVVKDFHFKSLHMEIEPLMMHIAPADYHFMFVRILPDDITKTMGFIEGVCAKFNPEFTFEYRFLDEDFENQYRTDRRVGTIFRYTAFLAVFISCLGLFGLASFIAEQRTREIGIRKVLGASVSTLVLSLTGNFIKWVLIANIIAWPAAYYFMNKWLRNFAYHIDMTPWIFVIASVITVLIALFTVSFQALKAARTNPADTIKYE